MSAARSKVSSTWRPPEGLEVWLDDQATGPLAHIGRLHRVDAHAVRFEYSPQWLRHPAAFELDPELSLAAGTYIPRDSNFGILMDSCPDRWGQSLMRRCELVQARHQGRTRRDLRPWDFFLDVPDATRMGALRFSALQSERQLKESVAPQFVEGVALANQVYQAQQEPQQEHQAQHCLAAPGFKHLEELKTAALELTRGRMDDLGQLQQRLTVVRVPGASLGGSRPKASLQDGRSRLWIAKFPRADDEHDWALREMLIHQLATDFRLDVAPAQVHGADSGQHHTFLTQRFDRAGGRRRFFTSAMALLGRSDSDDASYLDLAEFIAAKGVQGQIAHDLRELFRRALFNVATANRDDHLRNHGFIRQAGGWRLAPAYDMNPSLTKDGHALALDSTSARPELDTVMATAEFYRVSASDAQADLARLRQVLGTWEYKARQLGLTAEDLRQLATWLNA